MTVDNNKILGQGSPAAAADYDMFTVPADHDYVVSTLVACNVGVATTYRVHACIAGAAASADNAVCYDAPIGAGESIFLTVGGTFDATDQLTVRSLTGDVTFTAFGVDIEE